MKLITCTLQYPLSRACLTITNILVACQFCLFLQVTKMILQWNYCGTENHFATKRETHAAMVKQHNTTRFKQHKN